MSTESFGMIGYIFAENGPLECGIESSFNGTGWGAKGDFRWIWAPTCVFPESTPKFFRKHMPWGIGIESLGMNGWIFAENGPLERGIESSFNGTGWGAKGDFRWIWAPTRAFPESTPKFFRKHMPWGIGIESLGMIGCIFAENGPLERGIESSFNGTGWGAKGDFRWILGPNPCIFGEGPPYFPKAHTLRYRHRKVGNDRMYIRGEWALKRWHWIKFQWYRLGC